ncbi:MAG: aminomethyl-transferring glycine dehydrogenase [Thiotrichales bacterium]|nr:aminomethyl-transferring glycine dehydrogenase [Thiotrichales bacterium]
MTRTRPLDVLEMRDDFASRHIGPSSRDIEAMLEVIGVPTLEDLLDRTIPVSIRHDEPLAIDPALTEREAVEALRTMAGRNRPLVSMIGMGYYGTITPPVVLRNVLENPAWYTAYTPYQAEVSQGRLEALLNFQQMVMDLTGMELANASLLDEATAAAEAMAMAHRVSKSKSARFFVDADCHPQTIAVIRTRAAPLGIDVTVGDPYETFGADGAAGDVFGALVQYPGSSGALRDPSAVVERVHATKGLAVFATDLLALCLVESPGAFGADIVVGSAQRFGVPMGFGGPHAAFFATRNAYRRQTPGRIIGVSVDARGRTALRMALQTREQHIRREKATSNICTAQVLLAVMAGMYAVYHGPERLRNIAERVHRLTRALAAGLAVAGRKVVTEAYFDTITVRVPGEADALAARACDAGYNVRRVDTDHIGLSLDETTRRGDVQGVLRALGSDAGVAGGAGAAGPGDPGDPGDPGLDIDVLDAAAPDVIGVLARTDKYLTHPVFNAHHSETEMLRYLRRLAAKDVALDRSMIPLGSCTMKLNATAEMIPITFPGFADLHPFVPVDQADGYRELCTGLERMLCAITGFDAVSLQPNAGSQGEYAGLLCIRRYHESRGESGRDVCLIPASAHGTNPASAIMAGMRVVVVACDESGNVDLRDLELKAREHAERLAALMITYPSTHGVFEEGIVDICNVVHEHGGQVYMDGANLNAMVGLSMPARIGADVSHINLHKTFCIPHGGGGPGMGPIGVRAHLAPFLPDHPVVGGVNPAADPGGTIGTVSAAPWGSAGILPISWAYIAMMGACGLRRATEVAILSANYIAARLGGAFPVLYTGETFPVLYTGENGYVAHECIIDLRAVKASCRVTVEDVAKRLVDFGFHAPTMSFPVADTLMIEPTESESKTELDRFCEAMLAIRTEIAEIEAGAVAYEESALANAPHPADLLFSRDWKRPYSKERAFFPLPGSREDKFWPPVARVDNVYGDRYLACACPPPEAYDEAAD